MFTVRARWLKSYEQVHGLSSHHRPPSVFLVDFLSHFMCAGRVVVISPCDPDGDIREQCLRALAIKPEGWEFANVTPKQYAQCMAKGFCYGVDPEVCGTRTLLDCLR